MTLTRFALFAFASTLIAVILTYLLYGRANPHKISITPLNKTVSITNSPETMNVDWLSRHGFRTFIILRHNGFWDISNQKNEIEAENIRKFSGDADKDKIKFLSAGFHNKKVPEKDALRLRAALDASVAPTLIYSDETRKSHVIWAMAEALSPHEMSLEDILSAAEGFKSIDQSDRTRIARYFTMEHPKPLPETDEQDAKPSE